MAKKVVLIIIDSLMNQPLQNAIMKGSAPALAFLKQRGHYISDLVSSFPTMSVVIDSTLITGEYGDKHQVPGLIWYDEVNKRIISYGNGKFESLKLGLRNVLNNSLYKLNHQHLNKKVSTIYEELDQKGMTSGSINGIVYRGSKKHKLKIPFLLKMFGLAPKHDEINGPTIFSLGGLSKTNPENKRIWPGYGLCDPYSSYEVRYLIKNNKLPSFTLVYLPDNDHKVHKYGPDTTKGIENADKHMKYMLDSYPSWEEAIQDTIWIVKGDSGQTKVYDQRKFSLVHLNKMLDRYQIARLKNEVKANDQIVLCVNERMAYIHLLDTTIQIEDIVEILSHEERIDIIAHKENDEISVQSGSQEGKLLYRKQGAYVDSYHQSWSIKGNKELLDIKVDGNRIEYRQYPDVLARLYGALHSHSGRSIVITVKPGYEIVAESSPNHVGGGSHGSLHKQDSLVPMIVVGTDKMPQHNRIVDLKQWILTLIE